ncbi:hypothetical protein ACJX0J_024133, partial [Zea mays]
MGMEIKYQHIFITYEEKWNKERSHDILTCAALFLRFSDYSRVHDGVVNIGDESPLEISGIGSVQIKRNLISLGTLEAMGFKFSTDNGVLKAKHINNLYYFQGSTSVSLYLLTNFAIVSLILFTQDCFRIFGCTGYAHVNNG